MKTKKTFLTLFVVLLVSISSYAQQSVVPPSAAASSVGQSINSPVSLHTGSVGITIPLWTVESSLLSVPISVSYNGSGIKLGQAKGLPGMGWSLEAGGSISRVVRGLPDEDTNGWLNRADEIPYVYASTIQTSVISEMAHGDMDDLPDMYYFSFPGFGGSFIFDKDENIVTLPYTPIDIDFVSTDKIVITTHNGYKYTFGDNTNAVVTTTLDIENKVNFETDTVTTTKNFTYKSEWHLTKIETPDAEDQMTLSYIKLGDESEVFSDFADVTVNGQTPTQSEIPHSISNTKTTTYTNTRLSSITGKHCSASFVYANSHRDIDRITISNSLSQTIAEYSFGQDAGQLLYIKNNVSSDPPYSFTYYSDLYYLSSGTDYWGYYNYVAGKDANTGSLKGVLTQINFPTGGYKMFEYEVHNEDSTFVGGARIKTIITAEPGNGLDKQIRINYSYDNMRFTPPEDMEEYYITYITSSGSFSARFEKSFIHYPLGSSEGSHVSYGKVTVTQGLSGENGMTEYFYNNIDNKFDHSEDYPNQSGYHHPFPLPINNEWERGLVDSVYVYRKNDVGNYVLASKEINTYEEDLANKSEVYSMKFGFNNNSDSIQNDYTRCKVKIVSSNMLLTESKSITYELEGINPVESKSKYIYNTENSLLESSIAFFETEDKAIITYYLYPIDYTGGFPASMESNNIKTQAIEVVTAKWDISNVTNPYTVTPNVSDLSVLSGKIAVYDNLGREKEVWQYETPDGSPLPMSNFRFSNQSTSGLPNGTDQSFSMDSRYYKKRISFDVYDHGLLVQMTADSITSCTLYSYDYTYPMASITNATYGEAKTALGSDTSLFSTPSPSDATLIEKMNNLRDSLPDAFITSQTYNPAFGLKTSATGINGRTSYFTYDEVGRLITAKDHDGNIVKHNEYENNTLRIEEYDKTSNSIKILISDVDIATHYQILYRKKDYLVDYDTLLISRGPVPPYGISTPTIGNLDYNTEYVFITKAMKDGTSQLATSNPLIIKTDDDTTPQLVLSNSSWNFNESGGSKTIYITSNQDWSVSHNSNWGLTTSPNSGFGNGSLSIQCPTNQQPLSRTCTITITGGGITKTINIEQSAGFCPPGSIWNSQTQTCDPR